jgi:hypothetical protein
MAAQLENREETLRWAVLATHLNGARDGGKYDHISPGDVLRHVQAGDLLEYLRRELGNDVSYALDKMTEPQRKRLLQHCRLMAAAYEVGQFHVQRSGLALVVAYLLHLIQNVHVDVPA